jgi:chorismate dehydratase
MHAFDLGQEWQNWVGLPFVYAVWAVRDGADLGNVPEALLEAKRRGCARIGEIAQREAPALGLDPGFCRRYLQSIIHFDLGPAEKAGLHRFYALACGVDLARPGVKLEYHHQQSLAESR